MDAKGTTLPSMAGMLGDDTKTEIAEIEHAVMEDTNVARLDPERMAELEKTVLRKMDRRVMPMLWVMYMFSYLDRTNIGNAKVGGMEDDLELSSSDYSTALSIFFVGYLLAEVPSNMILSRSRPSLYLPGMMLVWGSMTVATIGVNTYGGLVAIRFFLGIVEAGYFPGVVYLLSCWYKPTEMAKRLAIFYSASIISGAFGGLLAGAITEYMDGVGGTRGWKWLFVIEGLATIVVSLVAAFVLPDYPATTKWLNEEERYVAVQRLVTLSSSDGERLSHWQSFVVACKDWKTWTFAFAYQMISGAGTISYFLPTLAVTLGYKGRDAQFMTVPIYVAAAICSNITAWHADRVNERPWHMIGAFVVAAASFIACAAVTNTVARYICICLGASGIWSGLPIFLSYASNTIGEPAEKRAVAIAMVNGLGNLASVYGSQVWPSYDSPGYTIGWSTTTAMISAAAVTVLFVRLKVGKEGRPQAVVPDPEQGSTEKA